ncbi:hypothetical protein [Gracilibacillus sp. YIM 98692]|uniref:hypothetical protein n=1 Tax=Gracilibacillus sp. YIM 98692 TaxID=2663532 RepID=UPI0013D6BBC9|nr:hypothetical protein [Gracilibacillus sp. YIM 98692]
MDRTRLLIKAAAIFALIGAFIGSDMAGRGSLSFRAVHAHILVVGWLSLFAFAVFYKIFPIPKKSMLSKLHVITAMIGSTGLPIGMWLYYMSPFNLSQAFSTVFFIASGSILLVCFVIFVWIVFVHGKLINED